MAGTLKSKHLVPFPQISPKPTQSILMVVSVVSSIVGEATDADNIHKAVNVKIEAHLKMF